MVFWLSILTGALVVRSAVGLGFYRMWALMFNIVISVYVAIFLTPVIVEGIPAAARWPYAYAATLIAAGIGTFLILYAASYAFLTGQLEVSFPKVFGALAAGLLGFLAGLLVFSFAALAICVAPIAQHPTVKGLGFDAESQQANVSYLCSWCDLVNVFVSSGENRLSSREAIHELLRRAQPDEPPEAIAR